MVTCVEWFRIDGNVAELYDVALLPGVACPMVISPETPEAAGLITWERRPSAPAGPIAREMAGPQGMTAPTGYAEGVRSRAAMPATPQNGKLENGTHKKKRKT